jgi:uncharacterized protein (DUF1330 family)
MPAYWIARARIIDPIPFRKYPDRSPSVIAKYGGRFLARGGRFQIMEGPNEFNRFVVIEFPTFEQGVATLRPSIQPSSRSREPSRFPLGWLRRDLRRDCPWGQFSARSPGAEVNRFIRLARASANPTIRAIAVSSIKDRVEPEDPSRPSSSGCRG